MMHLNSRGERKKITQPSTVPVTLSYSDTLLYARLFHHNTYRDITLEILSQEQPTAKGVLKQVCMINLIQIISY